MTRRLTLWGAGLAALLFLNGCGDYHPDYVPPDPNTVPQAASKAFQDTTPIPTDDDRIVNAADPLAAGGDSLSPYPSSNGSPSSATPGAVDPASVNDALAPADTPSPGDSPTLAAHDPMLGPAMPTDHSHWLRGSVFNAEVAVSLNNLPLGDFRAGMDQDITMHLRRGVNTVTFTYTPLLGDASAHLDVLESEHHPPIAPLATFSQSPQMAGAPGGLSVSATPVTQTFTFIAH